MSNTSAHMSYTVIIIHCHTCSSGKILVPATDDESSNDSNIVLVVPNDMKRRKLDDNNQSDDSCKVFRERMSKVLEESSARVDGAHDSASQQSSDSDGHESAAQESDEHLSSQIILDISDDSCGHSSSDNELNEAENEAHDRLDACVEEVEHDLSRTKNTVDAIEDDLKLIKMKLLAKPGSDAKTDANTVLSDTEINSPNFSLSFVDSNTSIENISMPIDIECGNEQQIIACDKCEPIMCFESRDALKTHVEHIHGITQ